MFGSSAFKTQCRAMENGDIKIPESNLRTGTYRLFQINRLLQYLGIYATKYSIVELNKIIVKSLPATARRKYMEDGGDDLEDQADILEMMTQLDKKFRLKKEFAELEKKSSNNNNNSNKQGKSQSSGSKGGNGNEKKQSNPCKKHDGAHEWKDCPDNKANQNKSKGDKNANKSDKKTKNDLHSTQAVDKDKPAKKSTPMVRVGKTETKEVDADLAYDSDDVSAMMVQSDNQQLATPIYNGVTVIDVVVVS